MPPAAGALIGLGAAAAGAAIAAGTVIVGALAAIGTVVVGTLTVVASTLTSVVAGLAKFITGIVGGIAQGVVDVLAGMVDIAVGIIRLPGALITGDLDLALAELAATIDFEVTALAGALNTAVVNLTLEIVKWVAVAKAFQGGLIKGITGVIGEANVAVLTPIKDGLETIAEAVDTIREPVESITTSAGRLRELISDIASLKIVDEMLKDTADISDLLGPIAEGKFVKTAQAIGTLARSIIGTTVATMDKIDAERRLLGATIDTFDERIETSIKEKMELTKAEVLTMVTPRMETLGRNQQMVIKGIARVSRHIEDESWFVAMFLRMLR